MFDNGIAVLQAQAEMDEAMDEAFKELKKVLLKNVTSLSPDDLPDIKFDRDYGKLFVENKYVLNHIFKGRKIADFMGVGNSFTEIYDWMMELQPFVMLMTFMAMLIQLITVIFKN